jgi:hypothetical protein
MRLSGWSSISCLLGWDKCISRAKRCQATENSFKALKNKEYFRMAQRYTSEWRHVA